MLYRFVLSILSFNSLFQMGLSMEEVCQKEELDFALKKMHIRHIISCTDKPCFEQRFINFHKGRFHFVSMYFIWQNWFSMNKFHKAVLFWLIIIVDLITMIFLTFFLGRGVFALEPIERGSFVLQYRWDLISHKESLERQRRYTEKQNGFLFDFEWNGNYWWYISAFYSIFSCFYSKFYST